MLKCFHCGKKISKSLEKNEEYIKINLNDSKTKYEYGYIEFHLDCFKVVAGEKYIPSKTFFPVNDKDYNWSFFNVDLPASLTVITSTKENQNDKPK